MYCNKCGNQLAEGAKFCTKCGTKFDVKGSTESRIFKLINLIGNKKKELIMGISGVILFLIIVLMCKGCTRESKEEITYRYNGDGTASVVNCEENITTVKIPKVVEHEGKAYRVVNIGEGVFAGCDSLVSVDIPDSVTSIGAKAFTGCSSLINIDIPDSVTSIGVNAFKDCTSLVNIEISSSLNSIEEGTFSGCNSLSSIKISGSVTSIGQDAFYGCKGLTKVEIHEGVTTIGENAFSDCDGILEVEVYGGGRTTRIGSHAFFDCDNLVKVEILENLSGSIAYANNFSQDAGIISGGGISIGTYAFGSCDSLSSVKLRYVTYIGEHAFGECGSLSRVEMSFSDAKINDAFDASCKLVLTD